MTNNRGAMAGVDRHERGGTLAKLIIILLGLSLLWFVVQVSIAGLARGGNPSLAVRFGGNDARSIGTIAQRLATANKDPRLLGAAEGLAREAVTKDPTAVDAFSALGLVAAERGAEERAARLFRHSESLSRRHLVTQVWLGSHHANRGDMVGAMRHYNQALSTQPRSWAVLLPAMASSVGDPEFDGELIRLLRTGPRWGDQLISIASKSASPDKAAHLLLLLDHSRLDIDPRHRDLVRKRLSWSGRADLAAKLDK